MNTQTPVLRTIDSAQRSIQLAVYTFTVTNVAAALIKAKAEWSAP